MNQGPPLLRAFFSFPLILVLLSLTSPPTTTFQTCFTAQKNQYGGRMVVTWWWHGGGMVVWYGGMVWWLDRWRCLMVVAMETRWMLTQQQILVVVGEDDVKIGRCGRLRCWLLR